MTVLVFSDDIAPMPAQVMQVQYDAGLNAVIMRITTSVGQARLWIDASDVRQAYSALPVQERYEYRQ